ncbi:MAG: DUF4160 domain-containing protein [Gammaproteobacteria bacterium]|nr:DUF4160 domain-containing protein [Gammaproteobacteria bacterium]
MPTVMRIGPYRFFYYSNESGEPPHIHVHRDSIKAKFWISPVSLASSTGFSAKELRELNRLVCENEQVFRSHWDEYFSD